MNLIVVTPPPVEPVGLEEVYDHLRLDVDDSPPEHPHDDMLRRHIKTATDDAERTTKRAFIEQRLRLYGPRFPRCGEGIQLLRPPLQYVLSVQYYDDSNILRTVDGDDYFITEDLVPQLRFIDGFSTPCCYDRPEAFRIDYVAGYEAEGSPAEDYAANVPPAIKDAILIGVQLLYDPLEPREREALEGARDTLLIGFTVSTA